ncbi:hypothetical protein [Labrys wisconsinensis]|uniref:DUF2635 domain-containing protein n=1 Tax=Labrys wisconsinensis TaxID=425677 RepID=A0ABU0JHU4_9HYPH|nr:hypothetical protein [Labrys wisconsinensis]MDQ0472814.1 hypothetical protein [Labrys wisconsinensis]
MTTVTVRPAVPDAQIPMPDRPLSAGRYVLLPADGAPVDPDAMDFFWRRLIDDGDVVVVPAPVPAPAAPSRRAAKE